MEKQYRLPRQFADKWLAALRSGEYEQGKGTLYNEGIANPCYCCLGVACVVSGEKPSRLRGKEWISDLGPKQTLLTPTELYGDEDKNELVNILSGFNDGEDEDHKSFLEIADFIEQNCELY